MVCAGTTERYWVKGFNGISDFEWVIEDPNGNLLPASAYTLVGRGDTIQVQWNASLKGGIYTFRVIEHTNYGCTGAPYEQTVILNSPDIFIPFNGMPDNLYICFRDTAELNPGAGFLDYLWQDGSKNQLYYTGQAGTYTVRLVDTYQNCSYDSTNLTVYPLPTVSLGNDTVLFGTETLDLDVYDPDFKLYDWSTGEMSSSITVKGTDGNQHIWVVVTDMNGCKSDTADIDITASNYNKLTIPAAFTPNGDGKNDTWLFPARENGRELFGFLDDVTVRVFNRWGKLVWKSDGMFKAWDGKDLGGRPLPMDSYHYIIKIKVGTDTFTYKGSVTIVR